MSHPEDQYGKDYNPEGELKVAIMIVAFFATLTLGFLALVGLGIWWVI